MCLKRESTEAGRSSLSSADHRSILLPIADGREAGVVLLVESFMDEKGVPGDGWQRMSIRRIEDLGDAVLGAGLEAMQMSARTVTGRLAHGSREGVRFSSGLLDGKVALRGCLSTRDLTLGVALGVGSGSRHWLGEVKAGAVGVFRACDEHDALYQGRSLYLAVTLPEDRLLALAEREGVVIDPAGLRRTGMHDRPMASRTLSTLRKRAICVHGRRFDDSALDGSFEAAVLQAFIEHLGRQPSVIGGSLIGPGQARTVARAREWIDANLCEPITIDAIAIAAGTSRRGLHRAFKAVLDEAPQAYVRRRRLHRIRRDLASDADAARTIASIANRWGIGELGRFAGRYRSLFGELPSETIRYSGARSSKLAQTA